MPSNPVYYDVLTLLASGGFGTLGSQLFGGEWGAPDEQILVLEGPGYPSDQPGIYEQPGVQVLVRGVKGGRDVDVYRKAKQVHDFLLTQPDDAQINGVCYKGFEANSNIAALGKDQNERFIYSANFYTWRNGARG
jgi:hypothetical protein